MRWHACELGPHRLGVATSTAEGLVKLHDTFAEAFGKAGLSGAETAIIYEQSMNTGSDNRAAAMCCSVILVIRISAFCMAASMLRVRRGCPRRLLRRRPSQRGSRRVRPKPILVGAEAMKQAVADARIVELDVRDVDEWIDASSSPYGKDFCPRKGRIPGAVWIEWYRMMKRKRPARTVLREAAQR